MKYEEIKIGDVFRCYGGKETVISKSDEHRIITTIDSDNRPTAWEENELHLLKPIKKELPEEGVLVNSFGTLVYRLSDNSIYGFIFGEQSNYTFKKDYDFPSADDGHWKPATPEQEKKFVEMLKIECENRGLFEDTKLEAHAEGHPLNNPDYMGVPPIFSSTQGWNKNGQIFYKGKFATPLKEEPTLELVSKAVKEIGDFTIEQTGSGVIILTPIKK